LNVFVTRPISAVLLAAAVAMLVVPWLLRRRSGRPIAAGDE